MDVTTAPLNHLAPAPCPDCRETDRCSNDCICPTCTEPDCTAESLEAWRTFAPVIENLHEAGAYWAWSTGTDGTHSVEVGTTVDIAHYNGEFIVSHYERTHAATRLDQEQGTWIDVYVGPDAESAATEARNWADGDR